MDTVTDRPEGHRAMLLLLLLVTVSASMDIGMLVEHQRRTVMRGCGHPHRDHPGAFVSFAHKPQGGKFIQPVSIERGAELLPKASLACCWKILTSR